MTLNVAGHVFTKVAHLNVDNLSKASAELSGPKGLRLPLADAVNTVRDAEYAATPRIARSSVDTSWRGGPNSTGIDEGLDAGSGIPQPGKDGPLMLSGRQALADLEARFPGLLGYHGSSTVSHVLGPRMSYWGAYPDGPPAVCADSNYDIPIFMALYKEIEGRKLGGYGLNEGGIVFKAIGGSDAVRGKNAVGYVHVFAKGDLELQVPPLPEGWPRPVERVPELRSYTAVKPFAIVRVTDEDFPYPIHAYPARS